METDGFDSVSLRSAEKIIDVYHKVEPVLEDIYDEGLEEPVPAGEISLRLKADYDVEDTVEIEELNRVLGFLNHRDGVDVEDEQIYTNGNSMHNNYFPQTFDKERSRSAMYTLAEVTRNHLEDNKDAPKNRLIECKPEYPETEESQDNSSKNTVGVFRALSIF